MPLKMILYIYIFNIYIYIFTVFKIMETKMRTVLLICILTNPI